MAVALASAYRHDEDEPASAPCAGGCGRRLRVAANADWRATNKPRAYSEARDTFGRKQYWCRACTEELWRRLG